jgi:hypothetical protein
MVSDVRDGYVIDVAKLADTRTINWRDTRFAVPRGFEREPGGIQRTSIEGLRDKRGELFAY